MQDYKVLTLQSSEAHDPELRLAKLPRFLSLLVTAIQSNSLIRSSHLSIVTGAAERLPSVPLP